MNKLSESVIDFCSDIGGDAFLVQGAGGNVSWKDGDTLWVKASGTWLSEAKYKEIFLPVIVFFFRKPPLSKAQAILSKVQKYP